MKNKAQIIAELNRLSQTIENSHSKLREQGKIDDLSHLDKEIATICQDIIALPAADAQSVQPIMADMISKLEALGIGLQEYQTRLTEQKKGMS